MASRHSVLRPPLPEVVPASVTVVSPPESRTQGARSGWPCRAADSATPASARPTWRASPSSASPRTSGSRPCRRASSAIAASAIIGVATRRNSARSRRFTLSPSPRARCAAAASGSRIAWRATTSRASAKVEGSGTVGPLAITSGSSPGTSEMARVTTRAGCAAAASRPPEKADRCLRTRFMSWMPAPLASSARFTATRSSSVSPSAGSVASEEPPPETSARTRSRSERPRTAASVSRAAAAPEASGTGCAPKRSAIRASGSTPAPGAPWGAMTRPESGTPRHARSTASAIFAAALPTPTTTTRPPLGGSGRKGGRHSSGSAARTAAANIADSAVRARVSSQPRSIARLWTAGGGGGTRPPPKRPPLHHRPAACDRRGRGSSGGGFSCALTRSRPSRATASGRR